MINTVIFEDSEALLIDALKTSLLKNGFLDVHVGVMKRTPQQKQPAFQVIVRSDGGTNFERVMKEEDFGINLYVKATGNPGADYATANRFARVLEAILLAVPHTLPGPIKKVNINSSPTRVNEDGEEEWRYIQITCIVKGTDYNILN